MCEPLSRPLYDATFAALAPLAGSALPDLGCGAGSAIRLAAVHGARVTGLDAAEPMLVVARERLPDADLRVGDLEALPFDDGTFDVVTAFNSVLYAAEPKARPRPAGDLDSRCGGGATGRRRAGAGASGEVQCPFVYPDLATAWRGQSSIGPFRRAIEIAGADVVRATFDEALEPHRQPDGSYRQNNVFRFVIARKPA